MLKLSCGGKEDGIRWELGETGGSTGRKGDGNQEKRGQELGERGQELGEMEAGTRKLSGGRRNRTKIKQHYKIFCNSKSAQEVDASN